jgi:hypothetical protein
MKDLGCAWCALSGFGPSQGTEWKELGTTMLAPGLLSRKTALKGM